MKCYAAPTGWWCSRVGGHPGPCAAWPKFWRHPVLWYRFKLGMM